MKEQSRQKIVVTLNRIIACLIILILGWLGMVFLANMKKPPVEIPVEERPIRVEAMPVYPEDVPVIISGFGEVTPLDVVAIAPEVSGRVVEVHPRLEAGETIPKGDILFRIDPRDYEARLDDAKARVRALETSVEQLKTQQRIETGRLETLKRSEQLARAEFDRLKGLLEKDQVGTQSGVDAAERAWNAAVDQADLLQQSLALYPTRIRETESNLASAKAQRDLAELNLQRCEVRAPFDARVKQEEIEAGQYVAPGGALVTLADDSVLEIQVPLDSRDARQWLRFDGDPAAENITWFNRVTPVICTIRWTEDPGEHQWKGTLHRVVEFNQDTRMLRVAVRIEAAQAMSEDGEALPLVEGMFCSVSIPGRTMQGVYRLPVRAVSYTGTVFKAVNDRLVTVPVEVARSQNEFTFVSKGLQPGDVVITTRLIDPLENSLLEIEPTEIAEASRS